MDTPIDLLIFCPNCGRQHLDRPDDNAVELTEARRKFQSYDGGDRPMSPPAELLRRLGELETLDRAGGIWHNPPHKSHLCKPEDGGCGIVFRVADVCTNGVDVIQTRGENDTWRVEDYR